MTLEKENIFQKLIEEQIKNGEINIESIKNDTEMSVLNILSDFGKLLNSKGFKKYKVVINGKKAKVISNTSQKGIYVKFDISGEIKNYTSIEEIESFRILKEVKKQ